MNVLECVRLAFESIKSNKLRSLLTMLGIIIGISSVITITTIGNSMQKTLSSTMSSLGGTNQIFAYVNAVYPDDIDWNTWEYPEMTEDEKITYQDILAYQQAFEGKVETVIISQNGPSGKVEGENASSNVSIVGTTPGSLASSKVTVLEGRDISARDNEDGKPTAVVSNLFVKYACDGKSPLGKQISVSTEDGSVYKFYVVGVYEYEASKFGDMGTQTAEKDLRTILYTSYTYANEQFPYGDEEGISYFQIMTTPDADPTSLAEETKDYFAQNKYKNGNRWQLECQDMASELGVINKVLSVITIAISVIAAISLLVGGVGVMNIMLVSVVERTKEIGIRKALGAKNRGIHMQFLTESIVICLVGGIIGILIGILNGFLLSKLATVLVQAYASDIGNLLTVSVSPSVTAIIVSVVFSMLIGVIFGSYPAKRAAKMSPIDALRYE